MCHSNNVILSFVVHSGDQGQTRLKNLSIKDFTFYFNLCLSCRIFSHSYNYEGAAIHSVNGNEPMF